MRTTIDIADPILKEVKRLQQRENKPLGRLVCELLAQALASQRTRGAQPAPRFEWTTKAMGARIDLADKNAVLDALDRAPP
jgi:hypothetical protein